MGHTLQFFQQVKPGSYQVEHLLPRFQFRCLALQAGARNDAKLEQLLLLGDYFLLPGHPSLGSFFHPLGLRFGHLFNRRRAI